MDHFSNTPTSLFLEPLNIMDSQQQMSIDTLLAAARLLDSHRQSQNQQGQALSFGGVSQLSPLPTSHSLLPAMLAAAAQQLPPPTLHSSLVVTSSPLEYSIDQQSDLRDLVGKIRVASSPKFCSSASTSAYPYSTTSPTPSRKSSASKNSRAAHNELEKTRRANLRSYLEKLKSLVPPIADASRNTTLALLTRARDHIKDLTTINTALQSRKVEAEARRRQLLAELAALGGATEQTVAAAPIAESVSVTSSRPESRCDSLSTMSSRLSRDSPIFLEYSPSSKPSSQSPRPPFLIDPVAEGLLPAQPALPISFPRPAATVFPSPAASLFDLLRANQATVH